MGRRFSLILTLLAALVIAPAASAHSSGQVVVTLAGAPSPVTAGGTVAYVATLADNRSHELEDPQLSATAPAGMGVVSVISAGSCTTTTSAATCRFGDVAPGGSASARVIMTVPSAPGPVASSVTWSSGDGDNDADDEQFTAFTSIAVQAASPDAIAEYVLPAGDTVSTGDATDRANPQSTTVAIPATPAGAATSLSEVNAVGPADACGPGSKCLGQISVVTIAASPFSATNPLRLSFLLDSSELPRHFDRDDLRKIPMFHDGVAVPNCTGARGVASPNPCVSARKLIKGKHCKKRRFTVEIDVNSSTNGRWRA